MQTTILSEKQASSRLALPLAPASYFAMTLGLAETGNAWRNATAHWHFPAIAGEIFELLAVLSFLWWISVYIHKWVRHIQLAKTELNDPVQSAFIALIPESVLLIALALHPYSTAIAVYFFWIGSVLNLMYGAYRLSILWRQERTPAQTTPPLFLTFTASVLVNALVAGIFGYNGYGYALLGTGIIAWLILDSAIAQQLIHGGLATQTRNFMGIYIAPPIVAFAAYQVLAGKNMQLAIGYALMGYALFLTGALLLSSKWLREQAFAPGYWAYTFAIATLSQGLSLFALQTGELAVEILAMLFFVLTNLVVAAVAIASVRLLLKGGYFPK
jgi:tellurite resistance protein